MPREGIMLCYPFEEKRFTKWGNQGFIQPKLDGQRCRAIKVNGSVDLVSSECNRILSVPHINKQLEAYDFQELDGELYLHGMDFEDIESIAKRTVNIHQNYEEMEFHIFDVINQDPQAQRFAEMIKLPETDNIKLVKPIVVESMDAVNRWIETYLEQQYEGFILRHIANLYKRSRSTEMMKFKPKRTDEYLIVGYAQEMSIHKEPKNSLGALVLDAGYGNGSTFSVGSGFTKKQRENLWQHRDTLTGLTCGIAYQTMTAKNGVPRFPVFTYLKEAP